MDFPHLKDTNYPHASNVDVYKFRQDFDYARFDTSQMHLKLLKVPWDMGEAHIGNRTYSGIGNVVDFGTPVERDAWISERPGYEWDTKYRDLHRDEYIDVAVPYDVAARYNYLAVSYNVMPDAQNPIAYESQNGVRSWFWFVREVEMRAPSTTRLHLMPDAWQTWIYDVDIPYMMLERGHAPMVQMDAATYLQNPIANCGGLLAPDSNYGVATVARHGSDFSFYDNTGIAVLIVCSSYPQGSWSENTPANWGYFTDGIPAECAFAMDADDFPTFLQNVPAQFRQTLKCMAFVPGWMLDGGDSFTFGGVACWYVQSSQRVSDFYTLELTDFGYPAEYQTLAKLYTYPYSKLVLTDETGATTEIHIEDTDGTLQIASGLNLIYPYISITAHLLGIGSGAARSVHFQTLQERTITLEGNWYDTVRRWNVPCYAIIQDAGEYNDFATRYDRAQVATAAENAYGNASADAGTVLANAGVQQAANSAMTTAGNTLVSDTSGQTLVLNTALNSAKNSAISGSTNNTILAENRRASVAMASAGINAGVGAVASAVSGDIGGAISSIVSGATAAMGTAANAQIANDLSSAQAAVAIAANDASTSAANSDTVRRGTYQMTMNTDKNDAANTATGASAANSAATMLANAARNRNTSYSANSNQVAQANLNAPMEFGSYAHGDNAATRPIMLSCNIVTQSTDAIARAGDEFLRYGYMYNRNWQFDGRWVPDGLHYCYWKVGDFWVKGLQVPDMYMDRLRFFLLGGVTVWSNPDDIGSIGIYDNMGV